MSIAAPILAWVVLMLVVWAAAVAVHSIVRSVVVVTPIAHAVGRRFKVAGQLEVPVGFNPQRHPAVLRVEAMRAEHIRRYGVDPLA